MIKVIRIGIGIGLICVESMSIKTKTSRYYALGGVMKRFEKNSDMGIIKSNESIEKEK